METILNSPLISKYISQEKINRYASDLEYWLDKYDSRKYIGLVDHFAIKLENEKVFNEVLEAFKPYCVDCRGKTPGLTVRKMHGRKIAVALLKRPLQFGGNEISCIEIMQPKPEFEGNDVVGFDHLELINPHRDEIYNTMKEKGADCYLDESNEYKNIVVSFINNRKERIKFTNKTLAEIVPLQINDQPERMEIIK